jgi:hypothetical protein
MRANVVRVMLSILPDAGRPLGPGLMGAACRKVS